MVQGWDDWFSLDFTSNYLAIELSCQFKLCNQIWGSHFIAVVAPTVGLKGQLFLSGAIKIMGLWAGDLSSPCGQRAAAACPHTKRGLTVRTRAPRFRRKVDEYWAANISEGKLHPGEKEKREWGLKRKNKGSQLKPVAQKKSETVTGLNMEGDGERAPRLQLRHRDLHHLLKVAPTHLKLQHGLRERIKRAALSYSFFMPP